MQMGSKHYRAITFGSYARITMQELRQNYVRKLRQIYVTQLRNETMQMGTKNYIVIMCEVTPELRCRNYRSVLR